jgi:hypothetical protein
MKKTVKSLNIGEFRFIQLIDMFNMNFLHPPLPQLIVLLFLILLVPFGSNIEVLNFLYIGTWDIVTQKENPML